MEVPMPAIPAKLVLRAAAVMATIQAAAHLALFLRSKPLPGSAAWPLIEAMKAQTAPGNTTYWGMYFGYGLLSALTAFFIAALIWLASTFGEGSRQLAGRLILVVLVTVALHAAVIVRYFFALPLYFDIIVAVLLGISWVRLGSDGRSEPVTR